MWTKFRCFGHFSVMVSSSSSTASARVAITLQPVNISEASRCQLNEVLYITSISLNSVFVFEFVKCV